MINKAKYSLDLEGKDVIGVVSANSLDFVKIVFDCFEQNQTVVFLSDETDRYKIEATGVTRIIKSKSDFGWCDVKFTPKSIDSVAQISFTSGTTGKPKGVLLTHRALNDVVDRLIDIMEIDSSIREYVGVPVNYSFGIGRCRVAATVGGKFYLPQKGFNPLEIQNMLLEGSINAISAVPSLWRILFEHQDIFGEESNRVKWIEIGSQYMSRAEKEKLRQIFPKAKIVQHYGLTEASRSTFLRIDQTQYEHLESVGKPYGKTEIKISADHRIMIRGPHVAENLLIAGQTRKNIDTDGWHQTNDLGAIKDGYLYYLGRSDDLINCGGIKVSPDKIEKDIREILNIQSGIAVARVNDSIKGEAILVGMLTSAQLDHQAVKKAAVQAIIKQNIQSADAVKFMDFAEFPATATGKIQRNQLTKLYGEKMEALQATKQMQVTDDFGLRKSTSVISTHQSPIFDTYQTTEGLIADIFKRILNLTTLNITEQHDFFELGGNSLTALELLAAIKTHFGKTLSIATLLENPTPQGLAIAVKQEGWVAKPSGLIEIQPEGNRPPLFALTGLWGFPTAYRQLAQLILKTGHPFWAMGNPEVDTIEEMGSICLKDMRSVQSTGPYYLIGYSFGGLLALEIAQQIKQQGEEVAGVILLDPAKFRDKVSPKQFLFMLRDELQEVQRIFEKKVLTKKHPIREKMSRYLKARNNYKHQKVNTKAMIIFSRERVEENPNYAKQWLNLFSSNSESLFLDVGHLMLDEPDVNQVAPYVQDYLLNLSH